MSRIAFTTVALAAAIVVLLVGLVRAAGLECYDALANSPNVAEPSSPSSGRSLINAEAEAWQSVAAMLA